MDLPEAEGESVSAQVPTAEVPEPVITERVKPANDSRGTAWV